MFLLLSAMFWQKPIQAAFVYKSSDLVTVYDGMSVFSSIFPQCSQAYAFSSMQA